MKNSFPMADSAIWNVAMSVKRVAVRAKSNEISRDVTATVFHPDHMMKFKSKNVSASWIPAHIARFLKHLFFHSNRYCLTFLCHRFSLLDLRPNTRNHPLFSRAKRREKVWRIDLLGFFFFIFLCYVSQSLFQVYWFWWSNGNISATF